MNAPSYPCALCGVVRHPEEQWFLLLEKPREDKIEILEWDDYLASLPHIYWACGAYHVQQLVAHWMATGSLGHPMAQAKPPMECILPWLTTHRRRQVPLLNSRDRKPLGELAVHRESLNRILQEQPESLYSVLDALMSALRNSAMPDRQVVAESEEETPAELATFPQ